MLRTQLREVEHGDPCALAARAVRLWTMHVSTSAKVTAVQPAVFTIKSSGREHNRVTAECSWAMVAKDR